MMRWLLVFLLSCLLSVGDALASRNISLPYSTDFTTDDISDLVWTDCGATVTYSTNGYSGGAVKLTPPTSLCTGGGVNGGMSTIGDFLLSSGTGRLNIRFLMKMGSTYQNMKRGDGNKFIDVHNTSSGLRYGILHLYGTGGATYIAPAVTPMTTMWSVFRSPGTTDPDHYYENASIQIMDGGSKSNVWICWEYEINAAAGTARLIMTEASGAESTITTAMDQAGNMNKFYIGGYHNGYGVADANNYLLIDNLAVSTTYIGPPSGFVGGGDTTAPTISITSPTSSSTYDNGASAIIAIGGTASDNVAVNYVSWSNDRGGSGSASGTTSWTASGIALQSGSNVITVTATDSSSNTATDTITVTHTPAGTVAFTSGAGSSTFASGAGSAIFQ